MNNKKIVVGIAAIILAAAIFIISEMMSDAKPPEHRTRVFPEIEERHVAALVINDRGTGVRIEKRDGQWVVTNIGNLDADPLDLDGSLTEINNDGIDAAEDNAGIHPLIASSAPTVSDGFHLADSASVQIAIEKILAMNKNELISENPANQASFEVNGESGTTVEIYAIGKSDPAVFYIGKSGPEWNSNYIRREGTDAVYLLRGGIKYSLFTDFEQWKKKIPEPEPEAVADADAEVEKED